MLREQPSLGSVGPSRAPPGAVSPAVNQVVRQPAAARHGPPRPKDVRHAPVAARRLLLPRAPRRCRRRGRARHDPRTGVRRDGGDAVRGGRRHRHGGHHRHGSARHARGAARRHGGTGLLRAGRVLRQHRQAGQHQPRSPAQGHLPRHDVRHLPRVRLRRDVDHRALRRPGGRLVHQRPHPRGQGPGRRGGQLAHGDRRPGQRGRQRPPPRGHVHHLEQPHLGRLPPCRRLAALRGLRRHARARQ